MKLVGKDPATYIPYKCFITYSIYVYTDILHMMQQTKETLVQFTDTTGPDQPVHSARLIRAFVICLQNQWLL